jgi:ATP-binding cassette subfamily C protein CydD
MESPAFLKAQKPLAGAYLSWAVGIGSLGGLLLIMQAWCLARMIDGTIFRGEDLAHVMPWAWGMLALILVRAGLAHAAEQVAFGAAARIKQAVRERLFRHVQSLGPRYLTDERTGDITTTIIDGVEALEAYYARFLPASSMAGLMPVAILAVVFPMDWGSALVMVLTAPLIPFFMILIGRGAEQLNRKQWKQLARMGGHFLDVIQGLTTLKLFNASRREAAVIARISADYRQATMKVLRVAFLSALSLEFFSTVSIAIVAVLIGFRLLFGELGFFTGLFVLLLAPEFYLPLRSLGAQYHARMDAIGAAERMVEILETRTSVSPISSTAPLPSGPHAIRLRNVHFAYEEGRTALAGVDFEIKPGERIALVGPSGSGKSTVINLLLGFIRPQRGAVTVDGADLRSLDLAQWRRLLAWVPQRPRLFHGTVADNIRLGLPDADDAAVINAARQANAEAFIRELPAGLETLVGEGGRGLSGGQVQRLALARAFLRDAELVVLDEPTANLDRESERFVQQAIDALAQNRALVTVAHRLATVQKADRILVLDRGRIVQQGSHEQLLSEDGLYRHLVLAQG